MVSTDYVPKTKDRMNSVLGSRGFPTKRNPRSSPWLSRGSFLHPRRLRTTPGPGSSRSAPRTGGQAGWGPWECRHVPLAAHNQVGLNNPPPGLPKAGLRLQNSLSMPFAQRVPWWGIHPDKKKLKVQVKTYCWVTEPNCRKIPSVWLDWYKEKQKKTKI